MTHLKFQWLLAKTLSIIVLICILGTSFQPTAAIAQENPPVIDVQATEPSSSETPAPLLTATPSGETATVTPQPPTLTPSILLAPTSEMAKNINFSAAGDGVYFRVLVSLSQPHDIARLKEWNIKVLEGFDGYAYVLVDKGQLEKLARLGFKPVEINSLDYMANVYNAMQNETFTSTQDLVNSTDFLMSLSSVDTDHDGLTDTEEAWWCTNPQDSNSDSPLDPTASNPSDGDEVNDILRGIKAYGPPFALWPQFAPHNPNGNCPDGDFDAVPDYAEEFMIGTSNLRESSDLDKFDDGQELFGVTYCPGSNGPCGYGILPRAEDAAFVSAILPAWVKEPGNSPFVAAFPEPEVEVVPSSLSLTRVATITTSEGTMQGTEKMYGTSTTTGVSDSRSDTEFWSNWEEVSKQTYKYSAISTVNFAMKSYSNDSVWGNIKNGYYTFGAAMGGLWDIFGSGNYVDTMRQICYTTDSDSCRAFYNMYGAKCDSDIVVTDLQTHWDPDSLQAQCSYSECKTDSCQASRFWAQRGNNELDTTLIPAITSTQDGIPGLNANLASISSNNRASLQPVLTVSFPSINYPRSSETQTTGKEHGNSFTSTHTEYEEQTISQSSTDQYTHSWSTATQIDSGRAADLRFTFNIVNNGTEYAREVTSLTFNVYIGNNPNPAVTYVAINDTPGKPKIQNLFPGDEHTYTSEPIALTLDQMRAIDEGAPIRIVMEDISFGQDQVFYLDALNGSVTVAMEDGYDDLDETVDTYLVPVWDPSDTVQDVAKRYFPVIEDADGNLLAVFTPEPASNVPANCVQDAAIAPASNSMAYCKHELSGTSWWNFYLSSGLDYKGAFQNTLAAPNTTMLVRIVSDRDQDGYNDRNEIKLGTNPDDPAEHPAPNLLAGYTKSCTGSDCTLRMVFQNTGNYDAYGVEAILYTPDGLVNITNNTIGGSGRVAAGARVEVGASDTFQYTITGANPKEPVIVVSYNDPQGNHRFIVPSAGLLPDLNTDLASLSGLMLPDPGVDIASTSDTQANFVIFSPHSEPITNGKLFVEYIDNAGNVAHEDTFTQTFDPGPTVIPVSVDTTTYPPDQYVLLAFFTDSQGNILDSSARPLASFGADPSPEANVTTDAWQVGTLQQSVMAVPDPWDFGTVKPGTTLHAGINLGNTGLGDLRYALSGWGDGLTVMGVASGSLSPSATRAFTLNLDTAAMAPGPFSRTLTLRTNDPYHGTITIHLTGIIGATGQAAAYKINDFRPWDQYVYVPGPHSQNDVVTFTHTLADDASRMFPLYLYNESEATLKGVGEYGIDFNGQSAPFGVFGNGADHDLTVTNGQIIYTDAIHSALATTATSGQPNLAVATSLNFALNQEVLVIQMQGSGAGSYEFGVISNIAGNTLTLSKNLTSTYTVGGNSKAQVIRVPNYNNLTVQSGGVLTAQAWDGNTGGVVAFRVSGSTIINGQINASSIGYRGGKGGIYSPNYPGGGYGESYPATFESSRNAGDTNSPPNGGGGGGGQGRYGGGAAAGGGGGSYGSAGTIGLNGGGQPGAVFGSADLSNIYLGSAGGGGGKAPQNSPNTPGGEGGKGGGIIMVYSRNLDTNIGSITANGANGGNCGNSADESGGGGGGSGGSILIKSQIVNVGASKLSVNGGGAGSGCKAFENGGSGGVGRIRIEYGTVTGTNNPITSLQQVNYYLLAGSNPTTIYMPEGVPGGSYTRYSLRYGQRSINTNGGDQLFSLTLPNRQYSSVTISSLVERAGSSGTSFDFKLDIGNNGGWDWSPTTEPFSNPVQLNSPNLANALNAYITAQNSSADTVVIPIRVNINTPADIFLFNLAGSVGSDADVQPSAPVITPPNGNPPSNIPEGSSVDVSATITNHGSYKAENFTVGFYLGDPANGGTLIGSTYISSLAAGAASPAQTVTWNTSGLLGNQAIFVKADVSDAVHESSETNNISSSSAMVKKKADLVITNISIPDVRQNENGLASVTVRNDGQADVTGAVTKLYLGADTNGTVLGSTVLDVPQGQSASGQITFSIGAAGPHPVFVKVDPDNLVLEASETNNTLAASTLTGWEVLSVDSGGANDTAYSSALGYGRLTEGTVVTTCGTTPEQSYRQAGSSESLDYQFDNLLPDRYYHLDLTFAVCSGSRNVKVRIDDQPISEPGNDPLNPVLDREIHITNQVQTVSLLLKPSDYTDGSVKLSILRSSGLSGPMVNLIKLSEVRYCNLDSGPNEQPWSVDNRCGHDSTSTSDGFNGWGTLPYQTVRFSETGQIKYKFSGLDPAKNYNMRLTYFEGDAYGRSEQITFDATPLQTINLSSTPRSIKLAIPSSTYADGSVTLTLNELHGGSAVISEVVLEEATTFDLIIAPPFPTLTPTPTFTPSPTITPLPTQTNTPVPVVPQVVLSSFSAGWSGASVQLNWSTTTEINNSDFVLYRSLDTLAWTETATIHSTRSCGNYTSTSPANYSYTDTAVTAGTAYYYRLQYSGAGCGGTFVMAAQMASALPLPISFGKSAPLNNALNQSLNPTLSWDASSGFENYEICYDTTNDNSCSPWISNATSTTKSLSGLAAGTTYYWNVRAVNSFGTTLANNSTWWSFTTVSDAPPAVIGITRLGADPSSAASISFTVTFSEAVTGVDKYDFSLVTTGAVSGAGITSVSGSGASRIVTVNSGTGSGSIRLDMIDNDTVKDAALNKLGGNGLANGDFTTGESYTIDKTPPTVVSITRGSPNPNGTASVIFTVTFSEIVTGVDKFDFAPITTGTLTGVEILSVNGTGITRSVIVSTGTGVSTGLSAGTLRLDLVDNDTIRDDLLNSLGGSGVINGNYAGGEIYTIEKPPASVASIVRTSASPTGATTVNYTVTFSEGVTGVDKFDFTLVTSGSLSGAMIKSVSGANGISTRTIVIDTGTGSGTLRLDLIDNDTIKDALGKPLGGSGAGNGNFTSGGTYTIEKTPPSVVSIIRASTNPTGAASVKFTVTFSEVVSGVDLADFQITATGSLTGTGMTSITGSGATRTITVSTGTGTGTGNLHLSLIDNDTIKDTILNPLGGPGAANGSFLSGEDYTIDKTPPLVISIVRKNPDPTSAGSVSFTVTFSKVISGVDKYDFVLITDGTLTGAAITSVTGTGSTRTVAVSTGTGSGTLRLDLIDNDTIKDALTNSLGGPGLVNGDFKVGEAYTVR